MTVNIIGRNKEISEKGSVHHWAVQNSHPRLSHKDVVEGEASGWLAQSRGSLGCATDQDICLISKRGGCCSSWEDRERSQARWADSVSWRRSGWSKAGWPVPPSVCRLVLSPPNPSSNGLASTCRRRPCIRRTVPVSLLSPEFEL